MDGETLLMLTTCASVEQWRACGLHTVKQQLYLRKLVSGTSPQLTPTVNSTITSTDGKPTRAAMKAMTEEERGFT